MAQSRGSAQVRTGTRGVEDSPGAAHDPNDVLAPFLAEARGLARSASTVDVAGKTYEVDADGKVVFQGKRGLRITIKGSKRVLDPLSNAVYFTRSYMAVFDTNGMYKADPNLVDAEDGQRIPVIERLVLNPHFGIGRDFWLLADMQNRAKKAEEEALVQRFSANPELLAAVAQRLGSSFVTSFEQAAPPATKVAEPAPTKAELAAQKAKGAAAPSSEEP